MGANELVGRKCLLRLLQHDAYSKIVLLLEEPLNFEHAKLEVHQVNFEKLDRYQEFMAVDDIFYCWGNQMKINHDRGGYQVAQTYGVELAKLALEQGAKQFLLLSSIAADPDNVLYYRREKWAFEEALAQFNFWATHVFRPSILIEDDKLDTGTRLIKNISNRLNNLAGGNLSKYKPISAMSVAHAMVFKAQQFQEGIHIYSAEYLHEYAKNNQEQGLSKKDG